MEKRSTGGRKLGIARMQWLPMLLAGQEGDKRGEGTKGGRKAEGV